MIVKYKRHKEPHHLEEVTLCMGPYIKDVRTEGGGGVGPKPDIVREVAWIYH